MPTHRVRRRVLCARNFANLCLPAALHRVAGNTAIALSLAPIDLVMMSLIGSGETRPSDETDEIFWGGKNIKKKNKTKIQGEYGEYYNIDFCIRIHSLM